MASPSLVQPAPSWAVSLAARRDWASEKSWSSAVMEAHSAFPSRTCRRMRLGCLIFHREGRLPCMLCTRLPGGGATRFLEVLDQGLIPLSRGCGQEPRHSGAVPNHLPTALLGRRVLGNLRLSGTCWEPMDSASGGGAASVTQCPWERHALRAALSLCGQAPAGEAIQFPFSSHCQSSHCWSPFLCGTHWPLTPPEGCLGPRCKGKAGEELRPGRCQGVSQPRAACSFLGSIPRSSASLGKARLGQSSLAPETLPDRASEQSWSSAVLEAHLGLPKQGLQMHAFRLPRLPPRRLVSLHVVHSASWRGRHAPPGGLGSGAYSPELGCGREPRHAGASPNHLHTSLLGRRVLGNLRLSGTHGLSLRMWGCIPHPGALGAWFSLCGTESVPPSTSWRTHPVALPFPLREHSVMEPLAVWHAPAPNPSMSTPGT